MERKADKIFNAANWKKAFYYLKKNGLADTFFTMAERLQPGPYGDYSYEEPTEAVLQKQRDTGWEYTPKFSIVVPAYHTGEVYLKDMIESVLNQTYSNLELIIADAGEGRGVSEIVHTYDDARIVYKHLEKNGGISVNTNAALQFVTGEYVGLLDHDDVLTPDALYEMNRAVQAGMQQGRTPVFLYSDEDKCDADRKKYTDPHKKKKFNGELLLSHNYICHFLVMQTEFMQQLRFRPEYDGAQDYDLVLRAAGRLWNTPELIVHIPKVLYHWRCHSGSTAVNPQSKQYAYDAGKRAVEDFLRVQGLTGEVQHLKHLGFYRVEYENGILAQRPEIGAVGGKILKNHKMAGGIYQQDGTALYQGLPAHFSGYMHQAVLRQEAEAVDIRCMQLRKEACPLVEKELRMAGVQNVTLDEQGFLKFSETLPEVHYRNLSIRICSLIRAEGYRIVWDPKLVVRKA